MEAVEILLAHGTSPDSDGFLRFSSPLSVIAGTHDEWRQSLLCNPHWFSKIVAIDNEFYKKPKASRAKKAAKEQVYDDYITTGVSIVNLLQEHGAHMDSDVKGFGTALQTAVEDGNELMVMLLFFKGASVDVPDMKGITPRALLGEKTVRMYEAMKSAANAVMFEGDAGEEITIGIQKVFLN